MNYSHTSNRNEPYVYERKTGKKCQGFGPKIKGVQVDVSTKIDFDMNENVKSTNIELLE